MYQLLKPTINELVPWINWGYYFAAWGVAGRYPDVFRNPERGQQAMALYRDAQRMLLRMQGRVQPRGLMATYPARRAGDGIDISTPSGPVHIATPEVDGHSVADFVEASGGEVTLFVFTAGAGAQPMADEYRQQGDDYSAFSVKFLADRLAEAFAEMALPGGCRLAIGYPSLPDHALKCTILDVLDPERSLGLELTCTNMIVPAETVCGLWVKEGRYL